MPPLSEQRAKEYWHRNVALMIKLMIVWFAVSFGCGILLFDVLNQYQIGGYKLGFWFAQQGSIYVFVILIFYYARKMSALDREFGLEDDQEGS
jgi:putative solute:sodium symporter small subunit